MFNIGPAELIVILLVALLIVGPKRLPEVGRSVGKALREIRRQTDEVRSSFEATINTDLDDDDDDGQITDRTGSETAVTEWGGEDDDYGAAAAPVEAPEAPTEPIETSAATAALAAAGTRSSRRRRKPAEPTADPAPAEPSEPAEAADPPPGDQA